MVEQLMPVNLKDNFLLVPQLLLSIPTIWLLKNLILSLVNSQLKKSRKLFNNTSVVLNQPRKLVSMVLSSMVLMVILQINSSVMVLTSVLISMVALLKTVVDSAQKSLMPYLKSLVMIELLSDSLLLEDIMVNTTLILWLS